MRKIIFLIHMSLDGYIAGPHGALDWVAYTDELESHVHQLHATTDAAIYGRVTYQMMDSYWPTVLADPTATGGALNHARWYDSVTKIVASKTLDGAGKKNTVVIGDHLDA